MRNAEFHHRDHHHASGIRPQSVNIPVALPSFPGDNPAAVRRPVRRFGTILPVDAESVVAPKIT